MSQEKLFQKKAQAGGEQYENNQKSKAPKRGAQPLKPKKAEGTKKAQKKPDEPPMVAALWNQFREYLREVSYELRKVVWPSRKETIGSTAVVLIIVILSAVFLGIVDAVLSRLIRLLVG